MKEEKPEKKLVGSKRSFSDVKKKPSKEEAQKAAKKENKPNKV